jgi:MtfA peptidase
VGANVLLASKYASAAVGADGLFPGWEAALQRYAPFLRALSDQQRRKLRASIQILVREKFWEGCGGLTMTDEIKVTIAAHASRLTLGWQDEYFQHVKTILVYPDAYLAPSQDVVGPGVVLEGHSERVGEAWHRGPVILAWREVVASARHGRRAGNVVLHEFAHQLDMENGADADGLPILASPTLAARWEPVLQRHYEQLCWACQHGHRSTLDCYGATNEAEFFAVATEAFFENPHGLKHEMPELYDLFQEYYGQDPAAMLW